ncbi:amidase [Streptococcus suis]|uniref:amidase n=1 Tax=Streptococcus suis TaxID=1307 RepID=UPI0014789ADD
MEWMDATAQAQAVNGGQVSAKELVQEAIEKIEVLNPQFNAVVYTQYDQALAEAEEQGFLGKPFAGVPLLLKDLGQNEKGHPSSAGSRLFQGHSVGHTDRYVQALKDLGFIILGRTNTPEFGFKNISDALVHGSVNLPSDVKRNAGGSSGGAAAALASGMVSIAAASDGGGSIRIPASFNSLIGLKPSRGRIPVGPKSFRGWQGASSNFALTKSVRDTKRLLYHFQTYQVEAPFPLATLSEESIFRPLNRPLKIAFTRQSPIGSKVSLEAQTAVLQLVAHLLGMGHQVEELQRQPLDGSEVMQSYYIMNSVETAQMFDEIEAAFGRPMTLDDMESMTWAIYQSGQTIPAKLYSKVLQDWDRYSASMQEFHQTYDILLTPTVADVAPLHSQFQPSVDLETRLKQTQEYSMAAQQDLIWEMFADSLALTPFTQQANITGQPSISLPTHVTKEGLPIGVQLTAAKGREDILLQLAQDLEDAHLFRM